MAFSVDAVRNHYQDTEEQKKKAQADILAEKRAKKEALLKVELEKRQQKEQAIRDESQRKLALIKTLVQEDSLLLHEAIEELKRGMFGRSYDPTKTIEANLENAMFVGALMNAIQKIAPKFFL